MKAKSGWNEIKDRLSSFRIDRIFSGSESFDFTLSQEELLSELKREGSNWLLGRFSEEQVASALSDYGVWKALADHGYAHPVIQIRSIDAFRQRLKILPYAGAPETEDSLLCELRVFDAWLKGPCPVTGKTFEVDALVIDWLVFQNPKGTFGPDRPRLPGQKYPGLGIMRLAMHAILDMARQIGKQAVVNIPEYYHNAVLYSPASNSFRLTWKEDSRRFREFLAKYSLAEASDLVTSSKIINVAKQQPFVWKPHEQILGLSMEVNEYFHSQGYLDMVAKAKSESRFSLAS